MKDREKICQYYICKGQCTKGKDASLYGLCQHCYRYIPRRGAAPNRVNNSRKKLEKIQNKEKQDWESLDRH